MCFVNINTTKNYFISMHYILYTYSLFCVYSDTGRTGMFSSSFVHRVSREEIYDVSGLTGR